MFEPLEKVERAEPGAIYFSKRLENHAGMVAYNFGRVHQTLRVRPPMETGIADHVGATCEPTAGEVLDSEVSPSESDYSRLRDDVTPAATCAENPAKQAVHAKLTKPHRKTSPQGEQPHKRGLRRSGRTRTSV